jgi:ferrous iron transport protein A
MREIEKGRAMKGSYKDSSMTLSDIVPGGRFVVTRIRVAGEIGRRLADMGFTEGSRGEMIRSALMRGPIQVKLRGYDLLIRRGEAACIEVKTDMEQEGYDAGSAPELKPTFIARGNHSPHGAGLRGFGRRFRALFGEPSCCACKGHRKGEIDR